MANKKMSPLSAILHELKRHYENSKVVGVAMEKEQDPVKKQMLSLGWMSENTNIAALCNLLEITAIPRGEMGKVVSELRAQRGTHAVLDLLLEDLTKS